MKEGRKPEYPEKTPGDELQMLHIQLPCLLLNMCLALLLLKGKVSCQELIVMMDLQCMDNCIFQKVKLPTSTLLQYLH